jgi:hypothetical protein
MSYKDLPIDVQRHAQVAYELWKKNPFHESLQFKKAHTKRPIYSVRIGLDWRALALKEGNSMIWFWIGSHSDYDRLLTNL